MVICISPREKMHSPQSYTEFNTELHGGIIFIIFKSSISKPMNKYCIQLTGTAGGVYILRIQDDSGSSAVKLTIIP
jgi:hypothetical protein